VPRPEDPTPPDPAHTFVTYTYDPVGNRLTEANHLGTTSYTYDGADWLTSRSGAFPGGIDPTPTTNSGVWSSGAAGYLGDDDYATVAPAKNQTRTHHYGAFDMDAITAEASIDRVTVTVEWAVGSASAQATLAAQAFVGGNPVSSPLTNTSRPTSDTVQSFEVAGLTRSQLASGTFEVAVSASRGGGGASFTARLDAVSVSVEYTGGSQEFTYDANGNLLTAAADTFSWDQANRLVSATANGVTETYVYAGDGRRLSVTSAGDTVDWLWDLNHPLPQLAVERDDTGQVLRRSTYGIGRIATAVGSDLAYHHHDGLGSMVDLTDPAGDALAWAEFQPFGAVRTSGLAASAPELPFGFTGEFTDPTGLIHLRARQYDPAAGRFLSTHPVAPLLTDPYVGTNVYVQNNPALVASTVVSQEVAGRECLNEGRFALAAGAITAAIRIKSWIRAWLFGVVISAAQGAGAALGCGDK
jgi:RHS repeat-associated protein